MQKSDKSHKQHETSLITDSSFLTPSNPQPSFTVQPCLPGAIYEPQQSVPAFIPQAPVLLPPRIPHKHKEEDKSVKATLESLTSIYIRQKPQYTEALVCCEFENVYYVYKQKRDHAFTKRNNNTPTKTKPKGEVVFKCKETSGCCARNLLGGSCRPFLMEIQRRKAGTKGKKYDEPFLKLERPCLCTCCCLARPYINVHLLDGKKESLLGKVIESCSLCDAIIDVHKGEDDSNPIYTIITSCCQCGLLCQCPFKGCNEVMFSITDPKTEKLVGKVKKVFAGTLQELLLNADNFTADFPADADWEAKALLLAATLLIDYRYFEEKPQKQNENVYEIDE
eukprot:TRINITY_DN92417_c0_g1_i1.p1 TRINITY_DN92417_c0_g1~~TRINITY_DN92417_c0_g1_i1.p1  ORF type:complete len:362 (-),score=25.66 TRINITY_DN92417_c0_g1_i1:82-1092(-)